MSSPLSNQQAAALHLQKHNQIQRLNEEQQENPVPVVNEFFSCYHLTDSRQLLWDWLQAGLTNNYANFQTCKQRSDLLFFYQKIEELIEANYLLIGLTKKFLLLQTNYSVCKLPLNQSFIADFRCLYTLSLKHGLFTQLPERHNYRIPKSPEKPGISLSIQPSLINTPLS